MTHLGTIIGLARWAAATKLLKVAWSPKIMAAPRSVEVEYTVSNSCAFGGVNSTLVFRRWRSERS